MIVKPKGGRGCKTPNPTKLARVQIRLLPINDLIIDLLDSGLTEQEVINRLNNPQDNKLALPDKQETIDSLNKAYKSKKSMKPILENLLTAIYNDSNIKLFQVFLLALTNTIFGSIFMQSVIA